MVQVSYIQLSVYMVDVLQPQASALGFVNHTPTIDNIEERDWILPLAHPARDTPRQSALYHCKSCCNTSVVVCNV